MNRFESSLTMFSSFMRALRAQISVGLSVPFDAEAVNRPTVAHRPGKRLDLCEERPGRMCRSGYGSLEVGGLRDRVDD
jgi:hypothetical protein